MKINVKLLHDKRWDGKKEWSVVNPKFDSNKFYSKDPEIDKDSFCCDRMKEVFSYYPPPIRIGPTHIPSRLQSDIDRIGLYMNCVDDFESHETRIVGYPLHSCPWCLSSITVNITGCFTLKSETKVKMVETSKTTYTEEPYGD